MCSATGYREAQNCRDKKTLIFFFAFLVFSGKLGKQSLRLRAAIGFFFGITAILYQNQNLSLTHTLFQGSLMLRFLTFAFIIFDNLLCSRKTGHVVLEISTTTTFQVFVFFCLKSIFLEPKVHCPRRYRKISDIICGPRDRNFQYLTTPNTLARTLSCTLLEPWHQCCATVFGVVRY